jgi:hypothetical protein
LVISEGAERVDEALLENGRVCVSCHCESDKLVASSRAVNDEIACRLTCNYWFFYVELVTANVANIPLPRMERDVLFNLLWRGQKGHVG